MCKVCWAQTPMTVQSGGTLDGQQGNSCLVLLHSHLHLLARAGSPCASQIDKNWVTLPAANVLFSPIQKNKGILGYFLILPSQLINTWFALKCKNITLPTLLIIRKYCFEVSLFLSYYPWQMFAREKLRGHFHVSFSAENGNHCAT